MDDLSVAIVSWNTRNLLDNCLQSIYDTTKGIDFEVIVVDNASSDGTPEMVRDKYPQVSLVANRENAGFAKANNQAYQMSSSRFFMLLNPDTIVHSGLQGAVEFLDQNLEAGVVGCKSLNTDGSVQISWNKHYPGLFYELLPQRLKDHLRTRCAESDADKIFEAAWVGGVCLTARREAIKQVGLLDESYYIYTEETDWCRRFSKSGWSVMHAPCVTLTHYGGQSTGQMRPQMRVELAKSKVRFMKKFRPNIEARFYVAILELITSLKLMTINARPLLANLATLDEERKIYTELQQAYRAILLETGKRGR